MWTGSSSNSISRMVAVVLAAMVALAPHATAEVDCSHLYDFEGTCGPQWASCTVIASVWINGPAAQDLSCLGQVTEVLYSVWINGTALTSLAGLESLEKVGGSLDIGRSSVLACGAAGGARASLTRRASIFSPL